jgi:hypothetical protein
MEKEYPVWNHALKFGAYLSIFLILIPIIVYLAGMDQQSNSLGYVSYILLFFGLAFSILQYRNTYNNGYIELGKAFTVGFLTGFVGAIITGIFMYFFYEYIAIDALIIDEDVMVENLLKGQPNMTEEQIEISLIWAKKLMTPPWVAVMSIFMYTLFSAFFALTAALFTKKKNPDEEF